MKISVGQSQTTSSIQSSGKSFGIQANGKAFKILSSSLYNYKILAVVREISCNARDAHAMSGNLNEPFHVTLPSSQNLHFVVRDFGPGLAPDDILGLYTTYFQSSKTESNEAIGGLGLGSKSPLSYSTSFQVATYHGGKKTTFLAFQNDNGEPDIYQLSSVDTTERTGLEVTVPVQETDIRKFRASASNVYKFFGVRPIVHLGARVLEGNEFYGQDLADNMERELAYEGSKCARFYSLRASEMSEISDASIWAQMGDVIYPVTLTAIFDNSKIDETKLMRFWQNQPHRVVLQCEIGELDINAGREGLSYDKATIARLKAILSLVHSKLVSEVTAEISAFVYRDEAVRHALMHRSTFGNDVMSGLFTWRGKPLVCDTASLLQDVKNLPEWNGLMTEVMRVAGEGTKVVANDLRYSVSSYYRGDVLIRQVNGSNFGRHTLNYSSEMVFVIVDEPLNGSKGNLTDRAVAHFGHSALLREKQVIFVRASVVTSKSNMHNSGVSESASLLYKGVAAKRDELRKLISGQIAFKNVMFLSELTTAPPRAKTNTVSTAGPRREVQDAYCVGAVKDKPFHLYRSTAFSVETFDPEDKTQKRMYLQGNKGEWKLFGLTHQTSKTQYASYKDASSSSNAGDMIHAWMERRLGAAKKGEQIRIYFLTEAQIEQVKNNPSWTSVEAEMEKDFIAIAKSCGKYSHLGMVFDGLSDNDVHKAMEKHSPDYKARATEWRKILTGIAAEDANVSRKFFKFYAKRALDAWQSSEWPARAAKMNVDTAKYPLVMDWYNATVINNNSARFSDYIKTSSKIVALFRYSYSSLPDDLAEELSRLWDSIPNKISVTDYLDQLLTGTK